ncbi:MAG TPA: hypothetical protein VHW24_15955 [Bryobacteraceae bacterium]|jgi:hypothetical protein|nr:hypothetical protein [Bryobacteraceae bacterium]
MEQKNTGPGCFVCETAIPMMKRFWSEATRDHFRNARVEFLKGVRSLIDTRIAHLSPDEHKGTHVTVE